MATRSSDRRPRPGDVIAYAFLWPDQADDGRDDAVKDRPCVIVLAVGEGPAPRVVVAPITSRTPSDRDAIPLGANALGLNRPSWIIPSALNAFRWPGPDLRRADKPAGAWWRLGALSPALRSLLADRIKARLETRKARLVSRTE